jgi:hypothetical protein
VKGVNAPKLTTVWDFHRFYVATSHGKILEKPTVDSVNTFGLVPGFTPGHDTKGCKVSEKTGEKETMDPA